MGKYNYNDRVRVIAPGDKHHGRVGRIVSYFPDRDMWAVLLFGDGVPDFALFYNPWEIVLKESIEDIKRRLYGKQDHHSV